MSESESEPGWEVVKLAVVETFANPWEAELALSYLEGEGVAAVIADEHLIRMDWLLSGAIGGVKLKVPMVDVERAKELLAGATPISELHLVTEEDEAQPRCPTCRSVDLDRESWSRIGFFLGAVFFGFPLPVRRRRWRCRKCGAVLKRGQLLPGNQGASPDEEDAEADRQAALGQGGVNGSV